MADIATDEFLSHLKALYPATPSGQDATGPRTVNSLNPWFVAAACAFNGSNRPGAIPRLYEYVMRELGESSSLEEKQRLTIKMRETLNRSGITSGYARAINSLIALYEVTPEKLRATTYIRNTTNDQLAGLQVQGKELFTSLYGETAQSVQGLLSRSHPDAGFFAEAIAYGYMYKPNEFISAREMAFILVATLIGMDTPRQIAWHLASSRRVGASLQEARAVRQIAMEVASKCGVVWHNGVPDLAEE